MCQKATDKRNQKLKKQLQEIRLHNVSNIMLGNIVTYTKSLIFSKRISIVPTLVEPVDNNIKLSYIERNGDRLVITVKSYSDDSNDYCFDYLSTINNRTKNIMNTDWSQVSELIQSWSAKH